MEVCVCDVCLCVSVSDVCNTWYGGDDDNDALDVLLLLVFFAGEVFKRADRIG